MDTFRSKQTNWQHTAQQQDIIEVEALHAENVPMVIADEHQRFYDKLRKKIADFIREKGVNDNISEFLLAAPDLFVLLARLMVDKRVPTTSKALAGLAVAYFISPVDLIPEVVMGAFGFMDDIVLAVFVLKKILVDVDQSLVLEHWSGQMNLLTLITNVVQKADNLIGKSLIQKLNALIMGKNKRK